MNQTDYGGFLRVVKIVFYIALGAVIGYIFFTYVFGYLIPFLIAYLIAMLIQPVVRAAQKKIRMPKKIATFLILLIVLLLIFTLVYFVIERVIYELNSILLTVQTSSKSLGDFNAYMDKFQSWVEDTIGRIPFLSSIDIEQTNQQIAQAIYDLLSKLSTSLINSIPNILGTMAKIVPQSIIFVIILIVSSFYIAFDFDKINSFLKAQMSASVNKWVTEIKLIFFDAISKYLKAYFTLLFITFCELAVGFLVIGLPYSFTLALIIAIIDVLPILGTGTVLIPWAVISLIQKDIFTGMALLILYAVITIVRQVIEPKIVGNSLGIYPVVTLICIYVGFNLFGFAGLVMFPVGVLILKTLNDTGRIHLWKNVESESKDPPKRFLQRKKK